jgi:hypothetical protein
VLGLGCVVGSDGHFPDVIDVSWAQLVACPAGTDPANLTVGQRGCLALRMQLDATTSTALARGLRLAESKRLISYGQLFRWVGEVCMKKPGGDVRRARCLLLIGHVLSSERLLVRGSALGEESASQVA